MRNSKRSWSDLERLGKRMIVDCFPLILSHFTQTRIWYVLSSTLGRDTAILPEDSYAVLQMQG